jgi:hypothetical protein
MLHHNDTVVTAPSLQSRWALAVISAQSTGAARHLFRRGVQFESARTIAHDARRRS